MRGAPERERNSMNNHPPRGHPSNQPPPPGNPAGTGATFFVDQKKGEINELKQVRCALSSFAQQQQETADQQYGIYDLRQLRCTMQFRARCSSTAVVLRRKCTHATQRREEREQGKKDVEGLPVACSQQERVLGTSRQREEIER